MPRRWLALLLALALVSAGCLGAGSDPVSNASTDEPPDGNETPEDGGSQTTNTTDEETDEDEQEPETSEEDGEQGTGEEGSSEDEGSANESEADEETYPPWPSPEEASIRPGVAVTASGQCTSNFLFRTPDNATLMLGVAAHCFAEAPQMGSEGCSDQIDPQAPGTQVEIEGASEPGRLVYSSWYTMQQANVTEDEVCQRNDFALVAIDAADRGSVHPAVQDLGGPTGLAAADAIATGDGLQWYGNTATTPDSPATNRHEGAVVSSSGWSFQAYSATPGVPGDSGAGMMLDDGTAAGVLVTVNAVFPASNGATKLDPALAFAHDHGVEAELVTWPMLSSGPLG